MKQLTSIDRDQIQFTLLEMMVGSESLVRVIDVFLDFACPHDLGFQNNRQVTGRPAFPTRTLLGIYIYGYLNRIRSSRALEKAFVINIELMWLLKGHQPCYKTIANFRKDNRVAFGKLFKLYRSFCLRLDLFGKGGVYLKLKGGSFFTDCRYLL
jgi:transposase